jgi:hypothetical protein
MWRQMLSRPRPRPALHDPTAPAAVVPEGVSTASGAGTDPADTGDSLVTTFCRSLCSKISPMTTKACLPRDAWCLGWRQLFTTASYNTIVCSIVLMGPPDELFVQGPDTRAPQIGNRGRLSLRCDEAVVFSSTVPSVRATPNGVRVSVRTLGRKRGSLRIRVCSPLGSGLRV